MARFVVIAAIYCAALVLVRHISLANWFVLTGLNLSVLLLVPYRNWGALMMGDAARLAYISATCYEQFGLLWALINLIPSMCYYAPLVWLFRERWGLNPHRRTVGVAALVLCSFLASAIVVVVTIGQILITPKPPGYVLDYGNLIARLTLGNFLGALTVVPIALVGAQVVRSAHGNLGRVRHHLAESRLAYDAGLLVLPLVVFLVGVGSKFPHARGVVQMALFLPVIWCALKHGWRGAAVSGTIASVAIAILMPDKVDHGTLQAQALLAMAITTMLLVGAKIAALNGRAEQERRDVRQALALAQRNVVIGEAQLRVTALALDHIGEAVHSAFLMMMGRLKHLQPAVDDSGYTQRATGARDQLLRLSDGLYPTALRERGLLAAMREGPLPRFLDEAGARYWVDVRGPASLLTPPVRLALYRIVFETIALRCGGRGYSDFRVRVRVGRPKRRDHGVVVALHPDPEDTRVGFGVWAVVQIDATRHPVRIHHVRWDDLNDRLRRAVSGLGVQAVADRAATFEGRVRERPITEGVRLIALVRNPSTPAAIDTAGAEPEPRLRVL
ncbi:MAG TPA: MASE1 domain-containing protein [Dyella sp.]|uniref:MASE1 domain-containing protein n=1 Tax=Dyella sp. TaxID=1869338 RepID=UPI002C4AB3F5|nr:MASE1 domain-containing protein [Dyella sp.]HTV84211.1 MASE1 domain-containing protein [Dyella sp.]